MSRPGGAGHALLFRDNGVVFENFKDLGEMLGQAVRLDHSWVRRFPEGGWGVTRGRLTGYGARAVG